MDTAARIRDVPAQAAACSTLGALHSRRGEHSKALDMFTQNYTLVGSSSSPATQGAAVRQSLTGSSGRPRRTSGPATLTRSSLGAEAGGAHPTGVASARCTGEVDVARCLLGLAQGNEMLESFIGAVCTDFKGLLDWKCNRVRPGGIDAAGRASAKETQ